MEEDKIDLIEKKYFNRVESTIEKRLAAAESLLGNNTQDLAEMLSYAQESFYTMDPQEVAVTRNMITKQEVNCKIAERRIKLLTRVKNSPYFGKIVFRAKGCHEADTFYIGITNVQGETAESLPLVCDWRAPVSSVYYDYESGEAEYEAPVGKIKGTLEGKRQFRIKNGKLEFHIDSSLTISDDILQVALSENTDAKMRTIVSTLQKEQNKVIRNERYKNLIVQGSAGSGKTSIALHRAAFMLYSKKDKLRADQILILSPNKIFSEYISDVLPELGENNILNLTFYDLAREELPSAIKFETRGEMLDDLISNPKERLKDVKIKEGFDFLENLKEYLFHEISSTFKPHNLKIGTFVMSGEKISELYGEIYKNQIPALKISWIAEHILELMKLDAYDSVLLPRIKTIIFGMFETTNLTVIYSRFLEKYGMKFERNENGSIRYEDVPPILFIKAFLFGIEERPEIKYFMIDEMQDFSPLQIELLNGIFKCNKILFGDVNQCIERTLGDVYLHKIRKLFEECDMEILNKSYRSTKDIILLASKISEKPLDCVDRRGPEPELFEEKDEVSMIEYICTVATKSQKVYNKTAVIVKTQKEAEYLFSKLKKRLNIKLSGDLNCPIVILPCYAAKGLEYDCVIIPNAGQNNYNSEIDRNILYISVTRALHKVCLVSVGPMTEFVK